MLACANLGKCLTTLHISVLVYVLHIYGQRRAKNFVRHNPPGTGMKSILDPSFRYTQSVKTDLRKTFARIRRELRKEQQAPPVTNVQPIRRDPALRVKTAR